jgi:plasmid maintenance system antidote protein VapI
VGARAQLFDLVGGPGWCGNTGPRALTEKEPPPLQTVSKSPVRPTSARSDRTRPRDVRHPRDHIDPKVWQRKDMRRYLAARDIGSVYRLLQRFGMSQRAIAARTGQSQSEISEIIAGQRRVVSYDVLERIAIGLDVPRGWMGLAYDVDLADVVSGGTS